MTIEVWDADFTRTNIFLSIESNDGRINNVSYVADFTPLSYSEQRLTHSELISLPYEPLDIKVVKFYSDLTSQSTFRLDSITFDPTYISSFWKRWNSMKTFLYTIDLFPPKMNHQTWYTLAWTVDFSKSENHL